MTPKTLRVESAEPRSTDLHYKRETRWAVQPPLRTVRFPSHKKLRAQSLQRGFRGRGLGAIGEGRGEEGAEARAENAGRRGR